MASQDEPVTESWLANGGFVNEHDYPNWHVMEFKLKDVETGFSFYATKDNRVVDKWGIEDSLREQSVWFTASPTVAQVLTVGRALGIPTERK